MKLSRQNIGKMIQFITGHNNMNRHQALIREGWKSECRLCEEDEETSWHIAAECPALTAERLECFENRILANPPVWSPNQLIRFVMNQSISELLDYQEQE